MGSSHSAPSVCTLCEDSSLSTAASITGIMTFAWAICATAVAYAAWGTKSMANSERGIVTFLEEVQACEDQARTVMERLQQATDLLSPGAFEASKVKTPAFALQHVRFALDECRVIGDCLLASRRTSWLPLRWVYSDSDRRSLLSRVKYIMMRESLDEALALKEKAMVRLQWVEQRISYRMQEHQAQTLRTVLERVSYLEEATSGVQSDGARHGAFPSPTKGDPSSLQGIKGPVPPQEPAALSADNTSDRPAMLGGDATAGASEG